MSKSTARTAVIQCADTGPLESLVIMLRSVGFRCLLPNKRAREVLRDAGCDLVLDPDDLIRSFGYDRAMCLDEVGPEFLGRCDLLVDLKAHRNYPRIVARWPRLAGRVLWYRINGGKPEHVIKKGADYGNELNPPCPLLTPNQWYSEDGIRQLFHDGAFKNEVEMHAYCCWPPFYRHDEYFPVHGRAARDYGPPVCLIHNLHGWGYGDLTDNFRRMGIKLYGESSPDGLVNHAKVPAMLSHALCMVHLKSSDAPGYALYEALAAACPVVCTRRIIWRCRMQELLVPGETCLVFDRETHDGLTAQDVTECTAEVKEHLERLKDRAENARIGLAGRARLLEVMWDERKDSPSLAEFLTRNFPPDTPPTGRQRV